MSFKKLSVAAVGLFAVAFVALPAQASHNSVYTMNACGKAAHTFLLESNPDYVKLRRTEEFQLARKLHSKRTHEAAQNFQKADSAHKKALAAYREAISTHCAGVADNTLPEAVKEAMPDIQDAVTVEIAAIRDLIAVDACADRIVANPAVQEIRQLRDANGAFEEENLTVLRETYQQNIDLAEAYKAAANAQHAHENAYIVRLYAACSAEVLHETPATPEMFAADWAKSLELTKAADAASRALMPKK